MRRAPAAGTERPGPFAANLVCIAREAMACEFSVFLPGQPRAVDAGCAALDEVELLERKLSIFLPESDISRVNAQASRGPVQVPAEVVGLLGMAARISAGTASAFDAASGAVVRAWGFAQGSKAVPSEDAVGQALQSSGMRHVELDRESRTVRFLRPGIEINLGGIGKGYAIDCALDRIRRQYGICAVLMQGGQSSVRAMGTPPGEPRGWKVAIGDPFRPGRAVGSVWLRDRALGSSAATYQFFLENGRRYGHILDPRTGYPAARLASASALAPTCTEADALSTAFFVMGVEGTRRYCRQHAGTGAILITPPEAPGGSQIIAMGMKKGDMELPGGNLK